MIIIIGGSYQGKKDFAKEEFFLKEEDFLDLREVEDLDYSKKAFYLLNYWVKKEIEKGKFPCTYIEDLIPNLKNKIIICDEIGGGIVPIKKEERVLREQVGKVMQILVRNSDKVYRVYSGVSEVIKE